MSDTRIMAVLPELGWLIGSRWVDAYGIAEYQSTDYSLGIEAAEYDVRWTALCNLVYLGLYLCE